MDSKKPHSELELHSFAIEVIDDFEDQPAMFVERAFGLANSCGCGHSGSGSGGNEK